ncbi:MAG TPA: TadE/TadG family type IV pilus assembly protein [Rhizomicrobium sp.]|jgi:Flp pilus assembly protein TadG|nr:TadE/TadG family type IV pilus assembly protein [Rhizomicrobium sp.]
MLRLLRDFRRGCSGIVAVEFAMILPVMLVLVFGAIEITDAVICKTDVSDAASASADLIAQESSVGTTDMNNVFSAINAMVYPFPVANLRIVITSVIDDGRGGAKVDWSQANTGSARTAGAPITVPAGLITAGGSVILAEVTYNFTPPTNWLVKIPITMTNSFYSHPRRVPQVKWTS